MASQYEHIKHFIDFFGIDLRSSDVLRGRGFSSDGTENIVHTPQGGIQTRWGSHIITKDVARYGLFSYETTDITGDQKRELVGIGNTGASGNGDYAHRLVESSFTLTNSNAAAATVYHLYDEAEGEFVFRIARGGSDVVNQGLGLGTEGSPYMLSTLDTLVSAAANLAMSAPTNGSTAPAAFMELLNGASIAGSGGTLTVRYWYWEVIPRETGQSELAFSQSFLLGEEFYRNASAVQIGGVLYFGSQSASATPTYLLKYDGNRIYRAGLPAPNEFNDPTSSAASPQAVTNDVRGNRTITGSGTNTGWYLLRFVNIDKAGNRVEGPGTIKGDGSSLGSGNILENSFSYGDEIYAHGFNRGWAKVNGAQNNVATITVDANNLMQAGDIAYFWDNSQSRYIQREVTTRTSTALTISTESLDDDPTSDNYDDGGNVSVLDNAIITNNSRIAVYRATTTTNPTFYLVEEIPNYQVDDDNLSLSYWDSMTNADLAERPVYVEDEFPHELPPENCGQISEYNGGLILSGDYKRPNTLFFSDVDGPEYFPKVTHNVELPAPVVGHAQSGEFLVAGTANSIHVTSGVLAEFNFRFDQIGKNIGLQSHLSMQEIGEGILAFSSNVGPYVLYSGRRLEPLGYLAYPDGSKVSRLAPFWTKKYGSSEEQPYFERSIGVVLPDDQLYLLFVPFEDPDKLAFATENSVVWAFDYGRGAWWKWTGLNMAGGAAILDNTLYFSSRAHDGTGGAISASQVVTRLSEQQRSPDLDVYIYADHSESIDAVWRSHWESLGEPGQLKKFLRCRISSHEERLAATMPMELAIYLDKDTSAAVFETTLSWTDELDLKPKLGKAKCRMMMVEMKQEGEYYQPLVITGYELEGVAPFRPEMKE